MILASDSWSVGSSRGRYSACCHPVGAGASSESVRATIRIVELIAGGGCTLLRKSCAGHPKATGDRHGQSLLGPPCFSRVHLGRNTKRVISLLQVLPRSHCLHWRRSMVWQSEMGWDVTCEAVESPETLWALSAGMKVALAASLSLFLDLVGGL